MGVPFEKENEILYNRACRILERLPQPARAAIRAAAVKVTVVDDAGMLAAVGENTLVAYTVGYESGAVRVFLNKVLAKWPAEVSTYVIAHELAHVALASQDDGEADAQVAAWGLGEEMRASRGWGELLARGGGVTLHLTPALEAA